MKKLLGILVLGLLLSGCYETGNYSGVTGKYVQPKYTECINHSKTGKQYCYTHTHRNSAKQAAVTNCKLDNPNNKNGCAEIKKIVEKTKKQEPKIKVSNSNKKVYIMRNCRPNSRNWGPENIEIDTSDRSISFGNGSDKVWYQSGNEDIGFKWVQRPYWGDDYSSGKKQSFAEHILLPNESRIEVNIFDRNIWQSEVKYNQERSKENSITCDGANSINSNSQSVDISFNIKQKREQCEAIGFEPETEKFADCVLRLVELDVKDQQNNKIVSAESSGNQALVDELKKQRDFESTQYLLNLGKELRNPQTTNSNIYMPQTQRCTIQGFGTFAKMVCR